MTLSNTTQSYKQTSKFSDEISEVSDNPNESCLTRLKRKDIDLYYELVHYRELFSYLQDNPEPAVELTGDIKLLELFLFLLKTRRFQQMDPADMAKVFSEDYSIIEQDEFFGKSVSVTLSRELIDKIDKIINQYTEVKRVFLQHEQQSGAEATDLLNMEYKTNFDTIKNISLFMVRFREKELSDELRLYKELFKTHTTRDQKVEIVGANAVLAFAESEKEFHGEDESMSVKQPPGKGFVNSTEDLRRIRYRHNKRSANKKSVDEIAARETKHDTQDIPVGQSSEAEKFISNSYLNSIGEEQEEAE